MKKCNCNPIITTRGQLSHDLWCDSLHGTEEKNSIIQLLRLNFDPYYMKATYGKGEIQIKCELVASCIKSEMIEKIKDIYFRSSPNDFFIELMKYFEEE